MFQSNYRYFYQTPLYDVSQIRITFTDKRINQPGGGASLGHKIKQYYEVSVARLVLLWKCDQLSKGAYMLHKNNFAHGSFPIDVLKVQKVVFTICLELPICGVRRTWENEQKGNIVTRQPYY